MKNPCRAACVFRGILLSLCKIIPYEYKGFARAHGVVGVVAFVDSHLCGLLDHGIGIRALRQPLQLRPRRRLRHGHRPAQHLPVDPGRNLRIHVRRAADDYRDARFRRAVRHTHRAGGALHAGLHEHPHAADLPDPRGGRIVGSGADAGRTARSVGRSAADLHHGSRGRRGGPGYRRAAAGYHRRNRHRGHAVAEVCRDQVLDGHFPGRRICRAVGTARDRFRTWNGRCGLERMDADALFAADDLHLVACGGLPARRSLL